MTLSVLSSTPKRELRGVTRGSLGLGGLGLGSFGLGSFGLDSFGLDSFGLGGEASFTGVGAKGVVSAATGIGEGGNSERNSGGGAEGERAGGAIPGGGVLRSPIVD